MTGMPISGRLNFFFRGSFTNPPPPTIESSIPVYRMAWILALSGSWIEGLGNL
jgi:hypothetical protein